MLLEFLFKELWIMTETELKTTLRFMVRCHGFEQVDRFLQEIRLSRHQPNSSKHRVASSDDDAATRSDKQKKAKVTALKYVEKMEFPSEKAPAIVELAKRFEDKSFLPTFGDIRIFCRIYGVDEPASKSRASAIPRIFKSIATLKTDDIQKILDDGTFSGPSRLGPIADAIRRNGRANQSAYLLSSENDAGFLIRGRVS